MRKKKGEITIRSSAPQYLTYVCLWLETSRTVLRCCYEEEKTVSQADQKIQNTLWELEKSYDILDSACKKRSSEMAQLETDMVTKIHRYQICIVLFGVFSFISYWQKLSGGHCRWRHGRSSLLICHRSYDIYRTAQKEKAGIFGRASTRGSRKHA